MDNLARPDLDEDFGQALVRAILTDGSSPVIMPLQDFLGQRETILDFRSPTKSARAALIADIAHFLNISHGRHPGVIDFAAHKIADDVARKWMVIATKAIVVERRYLNALTVAAGPTHRQQGQDKLTALLGQQSKNFEMLATSDRTGCPAGAAIAFVIDWQQTRPLLDRSALHLGMEPPACTLPSIDHSRDLANALAATPVVQRAMSFGARQLLGQQRGLWQVIAARHDELLAE